MPFKLRPCIQKLCPCIQKLCNVYYPPTPSLGWIGQIKDRSLSLDIVHKPMPTHNNLEPMPTHAHPWTIISHPCPPKTHGCGRWWAWAWAPNVGLWNPLHLANPCYQTTQLVSRPFCSWCLLSLTIIFVHIHYIDFFFIWSFTFDSAWQLKFRTLLLVCSFWQYF